MRYSIDEFKIMQNKVQKNFKPKAPSEQEEQEKLVEYMDLKGCKYSAIPNSTYTKSWKQKWKNKSMWVRAWLPDLFIIANNHAFFIEMKKSRTLKNNGEYKALSSDWIDISEWQEIWINAINKTEISAYICYWFKEAKNIIDKYCTLNW